MGDETPDPTDDTGDGSPDIPPEPSDKSKLDEQKEAEAAALAQSAESTAQSNQPEKNTSGMPGAELLTFVAKTTFCYNLFVRCAHARFQEARADRRVAKMAEKYPAFHWFCRWTDFFLRTVAVLMLLGLAAVVILRALFPDVI